MKLLKILPICVVLCLSGCAFPELQKAAIEPDPRTGKTPPQAILDSGTDILDFPLNLGAWGDLIQNIVILAAAGFGYKEWRRFRKNDTITPQK